MEINRFYAVEKNYEVSKALETRLLTCQPVYNGELEITLATVVDES